MKPLAIDLFCGLSGWGDGLIAEGFDVVGFDIEDMFQFLGKPKPKHFSLVIQDVPTLHGRQFRDASLIVASPPCQAYSWMAMPWKLAKAKAAAIRADTTGQMLADLNRLFDACFRIQAQASLAAGRHIPMVVENVRGAQPWVGRARWNFGSFYLWGDVPALMPPVGVRKLAPHLHLGGGNSFIANGREGARHDPRHSERREQEREGHKLPDFRFDGSGRSFQSASVAEGFKTAGMNWSDRSLRGQDFTRIAGKQAGIKCGGDWFNAAQPSISRLTSSRSPARKAASAMIAKIPKSLAEWVAYTYHPKNEAIPMPAGRSVQ